MAGAADILLVLICALAWFRGETPERAGALLLCATWFGSNLLRSLIGHFGLLHPQDAKVLLSLAGDAALALGFLILAIRYSSLWLGAVLMAQGAEFTLHSLYMSQESGLRAYLIASNVLSFVVLGLFLVGALTSWSRRAAKGRKMGRAARPETVTKAFDQEALLAS